MNDVLNIYQTTMDTSQIETLDGNIPSPPALLPPCRVCGEKASGFHYGANTCEACKGFFRRSLRRTEPYKCSSGREDCKVGPGHRSTCPYCRYNKCLHLGMSRSAIRTGRYTHEVRAKNITEVKCLQSNGYSNGMFPMTLNGDMKSGVMNHDTSIHTNLHVRNRDDEPSENKSRKYVEKVETVESILVGMHSLQYDLEDYCDKEILLQKQLAFYEYCRNQSQYKPEGWVKRYPCDLCTKSKEESLAIFLKDMEEDIQLMVLFAKQIPGFVNLNLQDQTALLRASRFETWLLANHKYINSELRVLTGKIQMTLMEMALVWTSQFMDELVSAARALQKLDLSAEEMVLLRALSNVTTDRCDLVEREKVEDMQQYILQCLRYRIEKLGHNFGKRFSQMISVLYTIRHLNETFEQVSARLVLEQPSIQEKPAIVPIFFNDQSEN